MSLGTGEARPKVIDQIGKRLLIKETFQTIQGEGPLAGSPCVFVRLARCNLDCWFCDTDFRDGVEWEIPALIEEVEGLAPGRADKPLCVITGGEPFAQPIGLFVRALIGKKWRVQIETAGTLWTDLPESPDLTIVCSPKTQKIHPMIVHRIDAWKYLVRIEDQVDPADGLPISDTQRSGHLAPLAKPPRHAAVFLQPVEEGGVESPASKANTDLAVARALKHGYRLSLQQHKILQLP